MPVDADLRQETDGPPITKANFDVWNEDELRFSGMHRCISCWDQTLLSEFVSPNHFLRGVIHTDKGKARVDGLASEVCPDSEELPMLGVVLKEITFPGRITEILRSALTPVGTGTEAAQIRYDLIAGPQNAMALNAETPKRQNPQIDADRAASFSPGDGSSAEDSPAPQDDTIAAVDLSGGRADVTRKGSLLFWPRVEVKWNVEGQVIVDTFLTLANDFPDSVDVQLYLVNGDPPREAVCRPECLLAFGESCFTRPDCIAERQHPGWNKSDVQIPLTGNQPTYWSAFSGQPAGVSSLIVLDPGDPPGRPDFDPRNPGGRVIRGFIVGWAVNAGGREICWNHLTGSALLVWYNDSSAAEYNAWAVQCVAEVEPGAEPDAFPGQLNLDGLEYEWVPDALVFDFYAVGSQLFTHPGVPLRRQW
jgi:hypothetical protein